MSLDEFLVEAGTAVSNGDGLPSLSELLVRERRSRALPEALQEITHRREAEEQIRLHESLLDAVDAAVIATDLDANVTHWNAAAERIYGYSREQATGRRITSLVFGPDDDALVAAVMAGLDGSGRWEGDVEVRRQDGTRFPASKRIATYRDRQGRPAGLVAVTVDRTERVGMERSLRRARNHLRAVTDSMGEGAFTLDGAGVLTHINRAGEQLLGWNRAELEGQVMHNVIHCRRPHGSYHPIEECPLVRPRRDRDAVRVDDDVFIRKDGSQLPVEYTSAPIETEDAVDGAVVVFSDISERRAGELEVEQRLESLSWIGRIRDALSQGRFLVYAQPIVDVESREIVRHELLLRMRGDDDSLIPPARFLPAAEEYGVIRDIDRWMLGQAVRLAGRGLAVNVNLSAQSVAPIRLVEELRAELERTGADPSLIVVELTETALLQNAQQADRFVEGIGSLGCRLALDDFGTGYGGFSHLKRLPVDFLKIDREFVRDLASNQGSEHVVRAVINLAKGFGQRTVAEGVEDERTLELLRELGVDHAQGYHVGRPAPIGEGGAASPRDTGGSQRGSGRSEGGPDEGAGPPLATAPGARS